MSNENTQSQEGLGTELLALGLEATKEIAQAELPIFEKYLKGRLAYWQSKGEAAHWIRIGILKEEIKITEDIIAAITPAS